MEKFIMRYILQQNRWKDIDFQILWPVSICFSNNSLDSIDQDDILNIF